MENNKDLPLRTGVGIVLLNNQNKILDENRNEIHHTWENPYPKFITKIEESKKSPIRSVALSKRIPSGDR